MNKPGTTGRRGFLKTAALGGGMGPLAAAQQERRSLQETRQADRTDSLEVKTRLLLEAARGRDYRLARALAASVKDTLRFAEQEDASPGAPVLGVDTFGLVAELPEAWRRWARGWKYYKVLALEETAGLARSAEPVEVWLAFRAGQCDSLEREIRVARLEEPGGALREVPCQVSEEVRRGALRCCRVLFLADAAPRAISRWLVFFGNPDAELTAYPSELTATGEGYGLDIENHHFAASLSRQTGQLERLKLKREHGMEFFSGGEGHGEPPGIDWAHDYVGSNNFQKFRITNWAECPDYEVIRGPLCVTVRRWGFPHSPLHPLFTPSRIHMFVEYRFYAGAPYFIKEGSMQVIQDLEITYLRDDEWVFSGYSFTDTVWMGADGKLRTGPVEAGAENDLWAVGFFNRVSRDAFIGLFLKHEAEGIPGLTHTGAPMLHYRWHGAVWSRALFQNARLAAGGSLRQKNAYLVAPFPELGGAAMVEGWRNRLLHPLAPGPGRLPGGAATASGTLARPGEAGDSPIDKRALWRALADCKDEQLYTANVSMVDLGLIRDIRVRGEVVHVVMTMPNRGRSRPGYFAWGSGGNSTPVRDRLLKVPGVRQVVVENVWTPAWTSNRLTAAGRRALGLETA
jgi:metal-sulfur cluster biosynthetic enzyme